MQHYQDKMRAFTQQLEMELNFNRSKVRTSTDLTPKPLTSLQNIENQSSIGTRSSSWVHGELKGLRTQIESVKHRLEDQAKSITAASPTVCQDFQSTAVSYQAQPLNHYFRSTRPSIKQSLNFARSCNQTVASPNRIDDRRQRPVYLYCLFTRLNKSKEMQLKGRNKIAVNMQNKLGHLINQGQVTLTNDIVTCIQDLPQVNKHTLIVGTKSSGKMRIMKHLASKLCMQNNLIAARIVLRFQIYASIPQRSTVKQTQSVPYNGLVFVIHHNDNLDVKLTEFWLLAQNDVFYHLKRLLHTQTQIDQQKQARKGLIQLLHNELHCIKILAIDIEHASGTETRWIVTSNSIPQAGQDWVGGAFGNKSQILLQDGQTIDLHGTALNALQTQKNGLQTIVTINPLKYRIAQSIEALRLAQWLDKR